MSEKVYKFLMERYGVASQLGMINWHEAMKAYADQVARDR